MKREILKQLMRNDEGRTIRVLFATIAIGIGVNIPNVRHVIHIGVPRTIESYYQEVGRAGRDNKPARASLFFNGQDISTNKPGMTTAMRNFCSQETNCLRKELLVFLGSISCRSEIKLKYERHNCCSNCNYWELNPAKQDSFHTWTHCYQYKCLLMQYQHKPHNSKNG
jgi:ATP-dependent DNA helicase RecQ